MTASQAPFPLEELRKAFDSRESAMDSYLDLYIQVRGEMDERMMSTYGVKRTLSGWGLL